MTRRRLVRLGPVARCLRPTRQGSTRGFRLSTSWACPEHKKGDPSPARASLRLIPISVIAEQAATAGTSRAGWTCLLHPMLQANARNAGLSGLSGMADCADAPSSLQRWIFARTCRYFDSTVYLPQRGCRHAATIRLHQRWRWPSCILVSSTPSVLERGSMVRVRQRASDFLLLS